MKILIYSLALVLLVAAFTNKKNEGYTVNGTAKGYADGTLIYLNDPDVGNIDSARVKSEKFTFKGKTNIPKPIYMMVNGTADYKYFWLENSQITIKAEKGRFKKAIINGSKTNADEERLTKVTSVFRTSRDSLQALSRKDTSKVIKAALREQMIVFDNKEIQAEQYFIKQNGNSLVAAYNLSFYSTTWGKAKVIELYSSITPANKLSAYGKRIKAFIALNKNLKPGDRFVDFEMADTKGKLLKLSDIKNKVILLEFWSSNCGPCRESNPKLVKTYEAYRDKGFEIFSVSTDVNRQEWLAAIKKDGLTWINVSDLKGGTNLAGTIYGINAIPDNFLIDKSGVIIARDVDPVSLRDKLSKLL